MKTTAQSKPVRQDHAAAASGGYVSAFEERHGKEGAQAGATASFLQSSPRVARQRDTLLSAFGSTSPGSVVLTPQTATAPAIASRPAQLRLTVAQLGGNYPGGNPRGRGGKGKGHRPPMKGRANRGGMHSKSAEEIRRRKAIGEYDAKRKRREQRVVEPEIRPAPVNPSAFGGPAPRGPRETERPAPRPNAPPIVLGEFDPEERDLELGLIAEERRRGMGSRVRDKAFGGRTFGDLSNLVGATGGVVQEDVLAGSLSIVGGAGVLASGIKLFYSGLGQKVESAEDKRERAYTCLMGLSNVASGVYGIIGGIATLSDEERGANAFGRISAAFWAATEAVNIVSQADIIFTNYREDKPWTSYIKPSLSMLASLVKCIGSVMLVIDALDDLAYVAVAGAAMGTLHGVLKLLKMCIERGGASEDEAELTMLHLV